jgi:hypothetical protein
VIKTCVHILLATVLIFSILVPSVFSLCSETDTIVLLDTAEEEKPEKTEKDVVEKILNIYTLNNKSTFSLKKRAAHIIYLESNIDHTLKVLLPPPKQNI